MNSETCLVQNHIHVHQNICLIRQNFLVNKSIYLSILLLNTNKNFFYYD